MGYISRYKEFIVNNSLSTLPFIEILEQSTDKYISYQLGVTRFDRISFKYYSDPTLSWLISMGNPSRAHEFDFEDGDIIRIPFPLESALQYYFESVSRELSL